jgi:hypothetical protein
MVSTHCIAFEQAMDMTAVRDRDMTRQLPFKAKTVLSMSAREFRS